MTLLGCNDVTLKFLSLDNYQGNQENIVFIKIKNRKFSSVADVISQFAAKEVSSALAQLSGQ